MRDSWYGNNVSSDGCWRRDQKLSIQFYHYRQMNTCAFSIIHPPSAIPQNSKSTEGGRDCSTAVIALILSAKKKRLRIQSDLRSKWKLTIKVNFLRDTFMDEFRGKIFYFKSWMSSNGKVERPFLQVDIVWHKLSHCWRSKWINSSALAYSTESNKINIFIIQK